MDISKLFEGQFLDIKCPGCEKEFKVDAGKVFKANTKIDCPHCKSSINLENNDAIKGLEKQFKELENMFN
ncbi:hypothetical protein V1503_18800 [Bacillus sp. SCS-151]|uniref:hypothetical protein n=1 Tax=Nanhaiella sioensis TaxID=3115293 RepID=UPI003978CD1C